MMDKNTMIALMVPALLPLYPGDDSHAIDKAIEHAERIWQRVLKLNP